ncbi:SH3 domain-containing protein [Pyronema omphalodes]|nr:SH3 domain-containing protein [Pyronema omphalodes]
MISLASNRDSWHPQFVSSLSYALVRDFAYPAVHPLHYGPTITEGLSTPGGDLNEAMGASRLRRLSDPVPSAVEGGMWADAATFRRQQNNQPPPLNFSDGPPWSEDDDLQSPVVVPKAGKHKSAMPIGRTAGRNPRSLHLQAVANGVGKIGTDNHSYYTHSTVDTSVPHDGAPGEACGPGGTISYDPNADSYDYFETYSDEETGEVNTEDTDYYNSRFSKDYQFTIASPAEEMHGKAVALFDFVQENENELPLVEGQVVWVSYRHGMGWLVAEDPKTGESGLVPEEYVCLLRDMASNEPPAPHDAHAHVSTFSTSSQDILPLDHESVDKMRRDQEAHWNEEEQRRASGESGRRGGDTDGTPRLGSVAFEDSRTEEERLEEERKREELERELAGVEGEEVQERVRDDEVHSKQDQLRGVKSNGL